MIYDGTVVPEDPIRVVIFTAMVMLSVVTLWIEHFFTTPTDVIATSISILVLLAPLRQVYQPVGIWYGLLFWYCFSLAILSVLALILLKEDAPKETSRNKASAILKTILVRIGLGRIQYFLLLVLSVLGFYSVQDKFTITVFIYAFVFLLIDPKRLVKATLKLTKTDSAAIGTIVGVQSKNTFLVHLYNDRSGLRLLDPVEFHYSMDPGRSLYRCIVVDNFLLENKQWIKILFSKSIADIFENIPAKENSQRNEVYKLAIEKRPELLTRFVGLTIDKSLINKLRFYYVPGHTKLQEGDLLEVDLRDDRILYQVIEGITEISKLESHNETGYVVGEAIQLGTWNASNMQFERYGWVPDINTPVFRASDVEPTSDGKDFLAGNLPGTNYQVIMNLQDAVSHHTAILGITGSGKSVFSRHLIRSFVEDEMKVICVDFTGEYRTKLSSLTPDHVVNEDSRQSIFAAIDAIGKEMDKFPNLRDQNVINDSESLIDTQFTSYLNSFFNSNEKSVTILDLPDVSNTSSILDYTRWFFSVLFRIAKESRCNGNRVVVVLEEAHTVIPEWNFLGVQEKRAQGALNSIAQIALQGRKYDVGLIVIAQRTANVSKTILTQCNTLIAFQEYDNTSRDFLGNHLPNEMLEAIRNLKPRQAIAVGKAFKSRVPLIFQVPEINEND
ncbi:MAG: ATP-binding protein [Spirochaetales bacterium]|nr:ATP-binding protein [Spirochaetales bacterium]